MTRFKIIPYKFSVINIKLLPVEDICECARLNEIVNGIGSKFAKRIELLIRFVNINIFG